ncbi:ABC-type taurine transport system, periplasmic component OS=Afipia felis OX=1035 GN=NCTC12722_03215 PE=4 SV=1 [Afipia felis]
MLKIKSSLLIGLLLFGACNASTPAQAETKHVRIAQQYGISYLPLMMVVEKGLLKKHAKEAGLGDIDVSFLKLAGSNVMNEALLSGSLDFASGGLTGLIILWAKSKGAIKAVSAVTSMPIYLNTRSPDVKTIADFTDKNRIALPAVRVSPHAVVLQMAAAKAFGNENYSKLDRLTVSLSHADGMAAMMSGVSEIDSHFTAPPYQYQELRSGKVHRVLSSYDVAGQNSTFVLVWAAEKFRKDNPKTYDAFVAALNEAMDIINKDKRAAAKFYVETSKEKITEEEIYEILTNPENTFTTVPSGISTYTDFMYKVGIITTKPNSWKDLFFDNAHKLTGN